jgi:hypothetical protein
LHPEEEIQGLIDLPQGWLAKCSQECLPSPNKVQTNEFTWESPRIHGQWERPT